MELLRRMPAILIAGLLGFLATAVPAQTPGAARPAQARPSQTPPKLEDRIMAVVNEEPILASEIDRAIALGLKQRQPGDNEAAFRRRVLNDLIEERLRFEEIDRFGFEQVPVDQINQEVQKIRSQLPDEAAFQKVLKQNGLTLKDLRQLVARQLMVLTYVDEQLGPRVFVSLDDISNYYQTVFVPEMQKRGQKTPPLEDVRDQIRAVLKEQRLNEAIEKWTEDLRRKADIQVFFDPPSGPLPPVVKRMPSPPGPLSRAATTHLPERERGPGGEGSNTALCSASGW